MYFDAEEGEDPGVCRCLPCSTSWQQQDLHRADAAVGSAAAEGRTTSSEVGEDGVLDPEGKPSLWVRPSP